MKALRVDDRHLSLEDVPVPVSDSEALVRVTCSGICNTDIEIIRGYADFKGTIGHEFVGVVEASPGGLQLSGKRVVGEINAGCGACFLCRSGDPRHCPDRTVLGIVARDGAHAEYLTLPVSNLVEVPENVSNRQAVFAEPLAAALAIGEQVSIDEDTSVGVIGDGKLGLLCAMTLGLRSSNVLLIGRHRRKLAIAEDANIEVELADAAGLRHRKFDVMIEASGSASGFEAALYLVRPKGKVVLKSTFHGRSSWPASKIVVDEISIIGSRCGRLGTAVALLSENKFDFTRLIDDEFPLTEGLKGFARAGEKGSLKVLLYPEGSAV